MSLITTLAADIVAPETLLHIGEQIIPRPVYAGLLTGATYLVAAIEPITNEIAANQQAITELESAVQAAAAAGIDPTVLTTLNTALSKFTNGTALTFLTQLQTGLDTAVQTGAGSSVLTYFVNEFMTMATAQAKTNPNPQLVSSKAVALSLSPAFQQAKTNVDSTQTALQQAQAQVDAANAALAAAQAALDAASDTTGDGSLTDGGAPQ